MQLNQNTLTMKKLNINVPFGNVFSKVADFASLMKDFCIEFAYSIVFVIMFLCSLIQPVFFGSSIGCNIFFFIVLAVLTGLITIYDAKTEAGKSTKGKCILGVGILCSLFLSVTWACTNDLEDYIFRNGKEGSSFFFNSSFTKFKTKKVPRELSFILPTTEGGYKLKYQCKAKIDAATWKRFNFNQEKLLKFMRTEARKRLAVSFEKFRLQDIKNMQQYYVYQNGVCTYAELR